MELTAVKDTKQVGQHTIDKSSFNSFVTALKNKNEILVKQHLMSLLTQIQQCSMKGDFKTISAIFSDCKDLYNDVELDEHPAIGNALAGSTLELLGSALGARDDGNVGNYVDLLIGIYMDFVVGGNKSMAESIRDCLHHLSQKKMEDTAYHKILKDALETISGTTHMPTLSNTPDHPSQGQVIRDLDEDFFARLESNARPLDDKGQLAELQNLAKSVSFPQLSKEPLVAQKSRNLGSPVEVPQTITSEMIESALINLDFAIKEKMAELIMDSIKDLNHLCLGCVGEKNFLLVEIIFRGIISRYINKIKDDPSMSSVALMVVKTAKNLLNDIPREYTKLRSKIKSYLKKLERFDQRTDSPRDIPPQKMESRLSTIESDLPISGAKDSRPLFEISTVLNQAPLDIRSEQDIDDCFIAAAKHIELEEYDEAANLYMKLRDYAKSVSKPLADKVLENLELHRRSYQIVGNERAANLVRFKL